MLRHDSPQARKPANVPKMCQVSYASQDIQKQNQNVPNARWKQENTILDKGLSTNTGVSQ
jgi:hypothetical protein